jgi:thiosulfate reductase cytochrome b subunit
MKRIKKYQRFERFWHWAQSALIFFLALTGFEVHDSIHIFGYEQAVMFHRVASYAFLVLIAFAIFWHFTTEQWKQYIPTFSNIGTQIRYYTIGIFKGEPHPINPDKWRKLNPVQAITYLGFKVLIIPVMVVSGVLYLFHKRINANDIVVISDIDLGTIAVWHTFGAFVLMAFVIIHVYMTTTGERPTSNIKAMVTGYEDVEENGEHAERSELEVKVISGQQKERKEETK